MPLSATDLPTLGNKPITIRSTAFGDVYLRTDGTGVTYTGPGGGTVNCQYAGFLDDMEKYILQPQADGSYSVESVRFPNVYVRMDGTGVTYTGPGGGTVNCQFNANGGMYEKFKLRPQANGSFSFESMAFPNVYLRMVASGVTGTGGTVNCQFNANGGAHETFFLSLADQTGFVMEHQQQDMWCWAASSVSVAKFYNSATAWTQCSLVNAELGRNDCCPPGATAACNQGRWPDTALRDQVRHWNERLDRALTFAEVGSEIAHSRPVMLNIAWAGGGGHITVVRGRSLSNGVEHVSVADPWYGDSDVTYNNFRDNYQNIGGRWNVTYKTRP